MAGQSKLKKGDGEKKKCNECGAEVLHLALHIRQAHTFLNECPLCSARFKFRPALIRHFKKLHSHMLGYLLPVSSVVLEKQKQEYPVSQATIKEEIQKLGISDLGGEWLEDDEYFIAFDRKKMRPLVAVEILTPQTLKKNYTEERDEFPYVHDKDLPPSQCPVQRLRKSDKHVSHLVKSANHRLSKECNDKTMLIRNLVSLHTNANTSVLTSTETHLAQVAENWWKSVLITVPVYKDDSHPVEGRLPEPVQIVKIIILGDSQVQCFVINNDAELYADSANFVNVRSTLEEINRLTGLNFQTTLPLSWNVPLWKCETCRFMTNDRVELKLHIFFEHNNRYCPRHGENYPTFDAFKMHVEAGVRHACSKAGCEMWFYNISELNVHVKRVHAEKNLPCSFKNCKKLFKTSDQLKAHLLSHQKNRERISCQFCNLTFLIQGHLNNHILMKHRQASIHSPTRVNTTRNTVRTQRPASTQLNADEVLQEQVRNQQNLLHQQAEEIAYLRKQLEESKHKEPPSSPGLSKKKRRH